MNAAPGDWFEQRAPIEAAAQLPNSGGVFCLDDSAARPILLASAQNIRRAAIGRLAEPDEPSRRAQLREIATHIRWTATHSLFETDLRYWQAARGIYPQDYRKRISAGSAWFLEVRRNDAAPHLAPMRSASKQPDQCSLGPFPARRDAEAFARMLEDLFDLCRYHHILVQTPHGQPCAYFDMGRCDAPCAGRMPMEDYRRAMDRALAFACGDRTAPIDALTVRMTEAAAAQRFEQAASLRETLARARSAVSHPAARWVGDFSQFRWLLLQRGGSRTRVAERRRIRPFLVRGNEIAISPPLTTAEAAEQFPAWRRWLESDGAGKAENRVTPGADGPFGAGRGEFDRGDEIPALVCRYLFRAAPPPGRFLRLAELSDEPDWPRLAETLFAPAVKRAF